MGVVNNFFSLCNINLYDIINVSRNVYGTVPHRAVCTMWNSETVKWPKFSRIQALRQFCLSFLCFWFVSSMLSAPMPFVFFHPFVHLLFRQSPVFALSFYVVFVIIVVAYTCTHAPHNHHKIKRYKTVIPNMNNMLRDRTFPFFTSFVMQCDGGYRSGWYR